MSVPFGGSQLEEGGEVDVGSGVIVGVIVGVGVGVNVGVELRVQVLDGV